MVVGGILIFITAFVEAVIISQLGIVGIVPLFTMLALIHLLRQSRSGLQVLALSSVAGLSLDILRPSYSPMLLILALATGIGTAAWYAYLRLDQRLSPHYYQIYVVPIVLTVSLHAGMLLSFYGVSELYLPQIALSAVLQLVLLGLAAGAIWITEERLGYE